MSNGTREVYREPGYCPICEGAVEFSAKHDWYRDHLLCSGCGSIPRERALALVLERRFPDWRDSAIHESSPGNRGLSPKLRRECAGYVESQFFRDEPLGKAIDGYRNENLEVQTFANGTFDLIVTQDVLEHVNEPADVLYEVARTLKPGGAFIFTVPTYKDRVQSERRARYAENGGIEHFADPEYHGNPISDAGSLVTFHYGYDLSERISEWSDMDVEVVRFHDRHHGIIGEFTEVYVALKREARTARRQADSAWPEEVQTLCRNAASLHGVPHEVHKNDDVFGFVYDHRGFATKRDAVNYYFNDGAASAERLSRLVEQWGAASTTPLAILEFGAGYGAVARHIGSALAPNAVHASDPDPQARDFIENALSVPVVPSTDNPDELAFASEYDVIIALAFFSRLPATSWSRWLQQLYSGLRKGGLLIFTTHGKASLAHFPQAALDTAGYWFDQSVPNANYGQCVTSKGYVDQRIAELPEAEYLVHEPALWWGHQDLYIVRKI